MEKLHLLLAEAGLELVPKALWSHPAVRASARKRGKKPGEILLDVALHHSAMVNLEERWKRGRPDIVHFCMLLALGSILNRAGLLSLHVHTYEGKVIGTAPNVRLPRNYNLFLGLAEQLLVEGKVPPSASEPLLWLENFSLKELVGKIRPSRVFLLSEKGRQLKCRELASTLVKEEKPMVVVGCFQAGDFREETLALADDVVAIAQTPLDAWVVVAKVLSSVEDELGLT